MLVALAGFGLEEFFLLLRFLVHAGLDGADAGIGLAFPFLLVGAEVGVPTILQFGFAGGGAEGQFLFALFELGLESQFLLLQFLLEMDGGLACVRFKFALEVSFLAALFLFSLRFVTSAKRTSAWACNCCSRCLSRI